jgi:hypothetical protein
MTMVNIRGTSGAGKSHLVRRVMGAYATRSEVTTEGRKQPLRYVLTSPLTPRPLWVLGHYNTACGGCDTIKTPDQVYDLVREGHAQGADVLYEGIMVQDDVRRCIEVTQALEPVNVVWLSTPIEECLSGVRERRVARGDERPLNEKNTRERARRLAGTVRRLRGAGVPVSELDREAAFRHCCELLLGAAQHG